MQFTIQILTAFIGGGFWLELGSSPNDVFLHTAKTVRLQVALGRPRDFLLVNFDSRILKLSGSSIYCDI
jgi:hypothetical protein